MAPTHAQLIVIASVPEDCVDPAHTFLLLRASAKLSIERWWHFGWLTAGLLCHSSAKLGMWMFPCLSLTAQDTRTLGDLVRETITKCQEESCLPHSLPAGRVYDQTENPSSTPRLGPIWKHNARTLSSCQDPMAGARDENMRLPLAQPNDLCLDPWKEKQGVQEDNGETSEAGSMCLQLGFVRGPHLTNPLRRDTPARTNMPSKQRWALGIC